MREYYEERARYEEGIKAGARPRSTRRVPRPGASGGAS